VIDLHTHVLPDLDDGPRDSVGSVALADAAALAGTRMLVATPHLRGDHPRVVVSELAVRVEELNATLRLHGVEISVLPGAEIGLDRALALDSEQLRAATLAGNGRDLLVETPYGVLAPFFEEALAELMQRGFRIILAHPERSSTLQADPPRLGRLVELGALVQVTASSLTGRRFSAHRRLAAAALRNGWVHVLASDSHGATHRPPDLRPALRVAASVAGVPVDFLVDAAPRAIVEGRDLPPGLPPARTRRWGVR
jgi:protein-tyrosine phosphatase